MSTTKRMRCIDSSNEMQLRRWILCIALFYQILNIDCFAVSNLNGSNNVDDNNYSDALSPSAAVRKLEIAFVTGNDMKVCYWTLLFETSVAFVIRCHLKLSFLLCYT